MEEETQAYMDSNVLDKDPITCHQRFTRIVKSRSHSSVFKELIQEWEIRNNWYQRGSKCECGHPIHYCWEVVNRITGEVISPVGSECIKRFQRKDFELQATADKKKRENKRKNKDENHRLAIIMLERILKKHHKMLLEKVIARFKIIACEKLRNGLCLSTPHSHLAGWRCKTRECEDCKESMAKRLLQEGRCSKCMHKRHCHEQALERSQQVLREQGGIRMICPYDPFVRGYSSYPSYHNKTREQYYQQQLRLGRLDDLHYKGWDVYNQWVDYVKARHVKPLV